MKRGARSIRGAMGTYAWVAAVTLLLTALALLWGPDLRPAPAALVLPADGPWEGAVIEREGALLELTRGARLELPAGPLRLRLFADDGRVEQRELELAPREERVLGAGR